MSVSYDKCYSIAVIMICFQGLQLPFSLLHPFSYCKRFLSLYLTNVWPIAGENSTCIIEFLINS